MNPWMARLPRSGLSDAAVAAFRRQKARIDRVLRMRDAGARIAAAGSGPTLR